MSEEDHEAAEQTPESRLLDQHPGVRELVESLPAFIAWSSTLPVVEVDGETFQVAHGDRLMTRDEIKVEWVRLYQPHLLERKPRDGQER